MQRQAEALVLGLLTHALPTVQLATLMLLEDQVNKVCVCVHAASAPSSITLLLSPFCYCYSSREAVLTLLDCHACRFGPIQSPP